MKFHPDFCGPGLVINTWINVSHASAELAFRHIRKADDRFLAESDEREILFVDLRLDPDNREIGQSIKLHPGIHHLPDHYHFFDHHPVDRSIDPQRFGGLPASFDLSDLSI